MLGIDPQTGLILLYGVYPLFSLKAVWFCLLSGLIGGIMVFFDRKCKNKIKGFLTRFLIALLMGFILFGILRDYFNLEPKEYIAGVIGFLSFPAFNWLFENIDEIVEGTMNKLFKKAGIEVKKKDKEDHAN